ncbi:tetratricopeptide repeat protein [Aquimarina spongiae]|uniref:TPR repeat-containing protein n=1 Tax=Aquimarina spongiae TaxID=570521 RepID=A0A1M6HCX7_9FLAO|nr:tetratricopeptide repeat protein [Aquimarina spongiae]SHJ20128.1 TPR repeat-containing protein [Aquimarina spongiae]
MKEDNFERFEMYVNRFKRFLDDPILEIWAIRFGNYFAKNNRGEDALKRYQAGLKKFPESAVIHNALGEFYANKGDKPKAILYYKKAIGYAETNKDSNLEEYKTNLGKL